MSLHQPGTDDSTADGFILAGGQSTRMGRDKALVPLAGKPLIQHAIGILAAAGLAPSIAGAQSDLSSFAPIVPDSANESGLGPLSGICSALGASSGRYGVFIPVDLPLLPASLIVYLLHHGAITQSVVTAVSVAGFVQTFPAVIDRHALSVLQTSVHSDDRNCLRAFRKACDVLAKPFSVLPIEHLLQAEKVSHPSGLPAALWFLNVNSPSELARAETILRASPSTPQSSGESAIFK